LLETTEMSKFSAISWQEQMTFSRNDKECVNDCCCIRFRKIGIIKYLTTNENIK